MRTSYDSTGEGSTHRWLSRQLPTLHLGPKSTSIVAQSAGATLSRPFSPFLLHFTLLTHCLLFSPESPVNSYKLIKPFFTLLRKSVSFFLQPLILYGFSASFRIFFPCVCSVTIESEPLWRLGIIKIIKLFQIPKPYLGCRHPFLRNPSVLTVSLNSIVIDICGPRNPTNPLYLEGNTSHGPNCKKIEV